MKEAIPRSTIAYFSMEIALEPNIPTYSGGLGVLAGDTLRSGADLGAPMLGITLVYRKGYFDQHLDALGKQTESSARWTPDNVVEPVNVKATVLIEGRQVRLRAWRYRIKGVSGAEVPVYMLDTDVDGNTEPDRRITDTLYGGDANYRLRQELVLGIGGIAILRALGLVDDTLRCHINEGHAALLTVALLEGQLEGRKGWSVTPADLDAVRRQCIFTTHTPVPAGHDRFPTDLVRTILGEQRTHLLAAISEGAPSELNMSELALRMSHYVNGVARRHAEVSRQMFPGYQIHAITNGIHAATWAAPEFRELFDRHIEGWRHDNMYLRYASKIPLDEVRAAHAGAKRRLLKEIERRTLVSLREDAITIGFARRSTPYKRGDLIFTDPVWLRKMTAGGPIQLVFAGKAHPRDEMGKAIIRRIFAASASFDDSVRIVYLENYDMTLGALMTAGCDVWLNNPLRPLEASGTSGMKAALNGVPSLSILDGWWIEGCIEGLTGWSIGSDVSLPADPSHDVYDLYTKLESVVLPLYRTQPDRYASVMRSAIALNGSFFNTQRMLLQYIHNAYVAGASSDVEEAVEPRGRPA
jgi:starch phosphorylase